MKDRTWRRRWCWLLLAVVLLAQGPAWRTATAGWALLVLDVAGVFASSRAARRGDVSAWKLVAAGRLCSAVASMATGLWMATGVEAWWWAGALPRYLMFALIATALLVAPARRMTTRQRLAFLAEAMTVLGAGFMVVWYFVLTPTIAGSAPSHVWLTSVGFPIGDLLLLMAASVVLLRGTISRLSSPLTFFVAGVVCYFVGDAMWSGLRVHGLAAFQNPVATTFAMTGALLMTVAALRYEPVATPPPAARHRIGDWSLHLPIGAVVVGAALFVIVTVRENDLLPWGGLVAGLLVMTAAIMARQVISLRDSRELIVTDVLTGLANRRGLDQAIRRGGTLMLIDLDGFKLVNDAYGHEAGDLVLTTFARHLRETVRHGDTCARIGGDEFAIWLPDAREADGIAVAQRLLVTPEVSLDDDVVPIRASVGLSTTTGDGPVKDLLRRADLAMYHAKRAGTHGWAAHDPAMTDRRAEDAALAEDLHHALDRGELHVLCQPIVDLMTGATLGAEALLRWEHPVRGPISPVRFIPLAERSGLISRIGLWVLEQALLARPDGCSMSVNLSPRQLQDPTLVHDVLAILGRTGTAPAELILEITESALVDDTHVPVLQALREHGIHTAIDDFGTGYSSLQYLTRLPVDILKIDRAFVATLDGTPEGRAIAEAVIRLAQVLGLTTIAEGIETSQQAAELQGLGCNRGQGYLYARPLPAAGLTAAMTPRQTT
ncbi:bifunctional diguanylate cyclase/phosphodiesterase [Actinoplanes sp. N902-109]|uniref:putative bifunctional diguanylate cyclase/phosphodiesterase n=1 Tax=Actinoplanes sp. (strain N902-109) TaxID=649831 RepID=UPI000329356E|nr:bifunctional diguanylate cyclase/phosphodiesterase [Actinoplanes sp. N902-109]AGL18099.1 PAS/PAC sensor-containing diguanylate cyclase/phosphodiesterase [Actinoplanes sp. N902-109]